MFSARSIFLCMAASLLAPAQVIPNQPGQWVPDGFLVPEGFPSKGIVLGPSDDIRLKLPAPLQRAMDGPLTTEGGMHFAPFWVRDHFYCISFRDIREQDKAPVRQTVLHRFQEGAWKEVGRLLTKPSVGTVRIIPCDQDRFIAISSAEDLKDAKAVRERSPFCSLTLQENGEFAIGSRIAPDCDPMGKEEGWFGIPALSPIVFTEDHATLLHRHSGLYWTFSLKNGSLSHAGRALPEITDDMIRKRQPQDAILALHPVPDNTILFVARADGAPANEGENPEVAVAKLMAVNPDLDAQDGLRIYKQKKLDQMEGNPLLRWFSLDPEKGTAKLLIPPPQGAPEVWEAGKGMAWRPLPNGEVRFGRVAPRMPNNTDTPRGR